MCIKAIHSFVRSFVGSFICGLLLMKQEAKSCWPEMLVFLGVAPKVVGN